MAIAPPPHTRRDSTTDDWITPRWLVDRLGVFDLDPCQSETQPWPCARAGISPATGHGLMMGWEGEVWMNPPYGKETGRWLHRLADHGNGVALVFARTDTRMFFRHVWPKATGILFLAAGSPSATRTGPSRGRGTTAAARRC
jgi:hypothetical protein